MPCFDVIRLDHRRDVVDLQAGGSIPPILPRVFDAFEQNIQLNSYLKRSRMEY